MTRLPWWEDPAVERWEPIYDPALVMIDSPWLVTTQDVEDIPTRRPCGFTADIDSPARKQKTSKKKAGKSRRPRKDT